MNASNQNYDLNKMEEWLENYFLDPLTSYIDQTQFRIDLFETEKDWIVEALLKEYESSDVTVCIEDKIMTISINNIPSSETDVQRRFRTIEFPFSISRQKITASFQNGVLEVLISKEDKDMKKKRSIKLP